MIPLIRGRVGQGCRPAGLGDRIRIGRRGVGDLELSIRLKEGCPRQDQF